MKKIFCKDCGQKLEEYFTGKFDEYSGERIMDMKCINQKCISKCRVDGHIYRQEGFIFGVRYICTRCGKMDYPD